MATATLAAPSLRQRCWKGRERHTYAAEAAGLKPSSPAADALLHCQERHSLPQLAATAAGSAAAGQ
eukprot:scaffold301_cov243-Pinguiococcus_pyrenoidosus.AAC.58